MILKTPANASFMHKDHNNTFSESGNFKRMGLFAWVIVTVCLAALLLLVGAASVLKLGPGAMPGQNSYGQLSSRERLALYLRNQQWKADVRTLASAANYLFGSEWLSNAPTPAVLVARVTPPGMNGLGVAALARGQDPRSALARAQLEMDENLPELHSWQPFAPSGFSNQVQVLTPAGGS